MPATRWFLGPCVVYPGAPMAFLCTARLHLLAWIQHLYSRGPMAGYLSSNAGTGDSLLTVKGQILEKGLLGCMTLGPEDSLHQGSSTYVW